MAKEGFLRTVALAAGLMFVAVWIAAGPQSILAASGVTEVEASKTYGGCREAWAAGVAPLYRGDPGYRPTMDGDSDGIACEPHR